MSSIKSVLYIPKVQIWLLEYLYKIIIEMLSKNPAQWGFIEEKTLKSIQMRFSRINARRDNSIDQLCANDWFHVNEILIQ